MLRSTALSFLQWPPLSLPWLKVVSLSLQRGASE